VNVSPTRTGACVSCVPSKRFSSRRPCQWTVASMSPWFVTRTVTVAPSGTFKVGPGIEPL